MCEISLEEFEKYIVDNDKYFINRWGGSDIYILGIFQYYYLKNDSVLDKINEYDDVEYYINYLSKYNGYYDIEEDKNIRYNNLILFFKNLKNIYISNMLNYNATQFYEKEFFKYFNKNEHLNLKYISYHTIHENKYYFENIVLEKFKYKKILIVSPFCSLINKQVKNLKHLYNKEINVEFCFLNTFITYFNEDNNKYINIPHNNFNETVKYYKSQINNIDFDIALLSCGSYAHFIGEYIKNIGKKAFYVGGILQLYFGLYGDGYLKSYFKWFNFNYCELNTCDIQFSFNTKEMCNTYIYNEKKHNEKLKNFIYDNNNKNNMNYIGSKINFLIENS
jgi:hypothetical protein